MTSIYELALGSDFRRLHPEVQKRFGFSSADRIASIGRGTMEEIWHGPLYTAPFLRIGSMRRILVPVRGRDVPFSIRNYAYIDGFGRETVTWIRAFELGRERRFDATMIYSRERGRVVDYLGTHQHLAVDIDLSVDERGGLRLRSGDQRFYEGFVAFPASRSSSPASRTSTSGSTRRRGGFGSRCASRTAPGGRCSVTGVLSTSSGCRALLRTCLRTSSRCARNDVSNHPGQADPASI